jgi:hypothetical protein
MSEAHRESPDARSADGAESATTGAAAVLASWSYSLAAFGLLRMQRYWQLPMQMVQAVSPQQLSEVRLDFETQLLEDYAAQTERLWKISHAASRQLPPEDYEAGILRAQEHAALIIDQAKAQAQRIVDSARAQADEMIASGAKQASSDVRRRAASA